VIGEDSLALKDRFTQLYHDLLISPADPMTLRELFESLLSLVRGGDDSPAVLSSVWKASLRTLTKLLAFPGLVAALRGDTQLDADLLVRLFLEAKLDPVDHAEEEQKILLKQQTLLKIMEILPVSQDAILTVFKAIVKEVKAKTVGDTDAIYSAQFGEGAKRNAGEAISIGVKREGVVELMVKVMCAKIRKQLKNLSTMENKKATSNLKLKDYLCFLIKTLEDAIRKVPAEKLTPLILTLKHDLFEVICTGAECEDVLVRNQTQILFTYVLQQILSGNIPLREELEILLVKVVLKPTVTLAQQYHRRLGGPQQKTAPSS
jgi:hypothetical protein